MSRVFDSSQIGVNSEQIITPASASYNNLPAFTWSVWVLPISTGGFANGTVLVKDPTSEYGPGLEFSSALPGVLIGFVNGTGGFAETRSQIVIPLGSWSNVIITFDFAGDKKVHMYINGVETIDPIADTLVGSLSDDSASGYYFGNDAGDDGWDGDLAEFAIWNTVLTGPQITAVAASMTGVAAIQPANLVGYWHLCGTMSPEPDVSGNGNNGALSANPPTQGPDSPGFTCSSGPTPPPPGIFSISGNVYTAGALLTLSGPGTVTTISQADGWYIFPNLGAGSYVVTPTSPGLIFTPASFGETITAEHITNINFYPTPPSPLNPYSVPDCRSSINFPNGAIDIQLTETYIIQTSSNSRVPSFDSRLAGQPQDSRKFPNIPLNCRVGPSGQQAQDLFFQEDGMNYIELEDGSGFIALEI
jgi:hypothetical protein